MVAVPSETPVMRPEVELIVTIALLLLLHGPPSTELESVPVPARHTSAGPLIVPAVADVVTVMFVVETTVPHEPVTE
jgi:hypothetical protein